MCPLEKVDDMSPEYKTIMTQDKIETDDLSFARVLPDQTCIIPLIPMKNPTRQLNWDVNIGKGAVYNPEKPCGVYGRRVKIGYGARINGSVFGLESVELESGLGRLGRGLINGTVASLGDISIREPAKRMEDFKRGGITVVGDIVGTNIRIDSPLVVQGNVVASGSIRLNADSTVFGTIYCKKGPLEVDHATAVQIIAGSGPTRIGADVSVFVPYIGNCEGDIRIPERLRVITTPCFQCAQKNQGQNYMKCRKHVDGTCKDFFYLGPKDIDDLPGRKKMVSPAWRIVREPAFDYKKIMEVLSGSIEFRKDRHEMQNIFTEDEFGNLASVEDLAPRVEQHIDKMFSTAEAAGAYAREETTGVIAASAMKAETERRQILLEEQRKIEEMRLKEETDSVLRVYQAVKERRG
jgi:hypothetical protein